MSIFTLLCPCVGVLVGRDSALVALNLWEKELPWSSIHWDCFSTCSVSRYHVILVHTCTLIRKIYLTSYGSSNWLLCEGFEDVRRCKIYLTYIKKVVNVLFDNPHPLCLYDIFIHVKTCVTFPFLINVSCCTVSLFSVGCVMGSWVTPLQGLT